MDLPNPSRRTFLTRFFTDCTSDADLTNDLSATARVHVAEPIGRTRLSFNPFYTCVGKVSTPTEDKAKIKSNHRRKSGTRAACVLRRFSFIMAATVLYNGYLIVPHAAQDRSSKRWGVSVDICSRVAGRPDNTISTRHKFKSRQEAEFWVMEQACTWIDRQL